MADLNGDQSDDLLLFGDQRISGARCPVEHRDRMAGIDETGRCWPYASVIVRTEGGTRLRVRGERLD